MCAHCIYIFFSLRIMYHLSVLIDETRQPNLICIAYFMRTVNASCKALLLLYSSPMAGFHLIMTTSKKCMHTKYTQMGTDCPLRNQISHTLYHVYSNSLFVFSFV